MNNKEFLKELKSFNACEDAIEWVNGQDFKTAWETCERADWMLWYIFKKEIATKKKRIHIICDCAETALKYIPEGENRPRKAIKAARKYADNPTEESKRAAAYAASAADAYAADTATTYATTYAVSAADAYAATYDVDTATAYITAYAADTAAYAAAYAADTATTYATAYAVSAAYAYTVKNKIHIEMCNMIRKKIKLGR